MTTAQADVLTRYPRTITLRNNTQATLRVMTPADADTVVNFASSLPEEELLFLRVDLTDPDVVQEWIHQQQSGRLIVLIAQINDEMAGYGNLSHNEVNWQRHLGEIRLNVGQRYRNAGLGRALAGELFDVARAIGLRKVVARMVAEQKAAQLTFGKLSFQPEALLRNYAIDRNGKTHDLLVMSYDVEGLTDRAD